MSDTFLPDTRVHRRRGFARSMVFSAARGAALIGLAVIIGVVLLQVIDTGKGPSGSGGGTVAGGGTTTTAAGTLSTSSTTAAGGSTTTAKATGPIKQPGQLKVVVLNASGVNGAAGSLSKQLAAKGYQMGTPATAATKRVGTVAACTAGLDQEAGALAAAVGPAAKTEPFPTPAPAGATTANCVVVLGS
jgi:hypothetical protein